MPDNEPAIPVDVPEDIDDTLIQEIEDYLKGVMDNNENVIEMSDNIIKSPGANCVAAAINFCSALTEVHLSNCQIRDPGAKTIFSEVAMSKTVQVLDLSRNPITERSFDALEKMLNQNSTIQKVILSGIEVKNSFSWGRLKKFGSIIVQ